MDYKKIIKNKNLRFKLLNMLSWIPDKTMVKIQYKIKTGRTLNMKKPKRFTEKLQLYKLYYRNPLMHKCADKYEARKYIETIGLKDILPKIYGVYNNIYEICYDNLPDRFVIKTTSGSGGNNVYICKDKSKINIEEINNKILYWLKSNPKKSYGREWAYETNVNKIIIEEYLEDKSGMLNDYKIFCFNGIPKFMYIISERVLGISAKLGIYDIKGEKIDVYRCDEEKQLEKICIPKNFKKMLEMAKKISKPFPHARIDFYNIDGKIYFGEITFYDGSGYMKYDPDEFDYKVGEYFNYDFKKGQKYED